MNLSLSNYNIHKTQVKDLLKLSQMPLKPHLLLYGPPGTGKTTLAKLYIAHCAAKPHNVLTLNASNTRGIDTVRHTILEFVKFASFDSALKYVMLDEADYLTADAQAALRQIMQTNIKFCNFILICNNIYKLNPAIISRCKTIKVSALTDTESKTVVNNLKLANAVTISDAQTNRLVAAAKGDIRYLINNLNFTELDCWALTELLSYDADILLEKCLNTDKPIKTHLQSILRQIVELPVSYDKKVEAIYRLAECDCHISTGGSQSIQFIAMINQLKKVLK